MQRIPWSKQDKMKLKWGLLFTAPAILGFLIFTAGPMLASFYLSFTDYRVTNTPQFIRFQNYLNLFNGTDKYFAKSLGVTFYYVSLSVPIGIIYTFLIALLLNTKVKGLTFFRTVFYIPSLVPTVATSMIWMWLMNPDFGLFNAVLKIVGLPQSKWIYGESTVVPSIVLMSLWTSGSTIIIFLAGLQDVPKVLYEALEVDGGSYRHKLIYVTIPTLSPTIFFNVVMAIIGGFQVFTQSYVMTNGGPNNASLFYAFYLWRESFQNRNMAGGCALAWVLFLIIIVFSSFVFRTQCKWVTYDR